jgi:anthranilate phosphoribosyltransferase
MKNILNHLFDQKTLTRQESEEVLTNVAANRYSESEIAAFISVYLMRSITVEELSGFRDALLNQCVKIDLSDFKAIDVCGTGGDGKDTFNVSTLSTFVLAGAGINVAKHGNYGVTSSCGSSNVMEHFGYKFSNDAGKLKNEIDKTGVCFMHAPLFNPAMKTVVPVRKALKVKTFFNMLGPMVNPSFPGSQLIGVYSLELARLYNYMFQNSSSNYSIIYSLDGYDEISLTSEFKYILNGVEQIISPESLGYERTVPSDLYGGKSVNEASEIFINILKGKGTNQQNNVVVANTQVAVKCYYPLKSFDECRGMAEDSLFGGKALRSFTRLIEMQP